MTTDPILLINSGAYVDQELAAEFGLLPPAFLPVGLRRLYELQLDATAELNADTYLTVPASFSISDWDRDRLTERRVRLIATPDGASLGAALLLVLAELGFPGRPLRLLHGDTLVQGVAACPENALATAPGQDGYRWGSVQTIEGGIARVTAPGDAHEPSDDRLCGYYSFENACLLAQALAAEGGNFFAALTAYARAKTLTTFSPASWLDFGHVQTFFRSRRIASTERGFNSLQLTDTAVRKRSSNTAKLRAEAQWLTAVPPELRPYTVRFLGEGEDDEGYFYDTEYEYIPTLAELFVFGRLKRATWERILASCKTFLDLASGTGHSPDSGLRTLVIDKTVARVEAFAAATGLDLDADNVLNGRPAPSIRRCIGQLEAVLQDDVGQPSVMHGDLCFSNILYDLRRDRIRTLDARGLLDDGTVSIFGDVRYDCAKLMHSAVGLYDWIIAGRFACQRDRANAFRLDFPQDTERAWLSRRLGAMTMGGASLGSPVVAATTASLFLSMPPLHADRPDRQSAFIANALRLFIELDRR